MSLIPVKDVGRVMLDSWTEIVNKGRKRPISRSDAAKLFFGSYGGILADTEEAHIAEIERLMKDGP